MTSDDLDNDLDIDDAPPRRAVIGAGKVGGLLARADNCAVVTRYRGWSALDEAAGDPIAVCVHNDDLASVLTNVPKQRRTDLVFLQPGILDPWLEDHGLDGNTRGLLYFSVPERGAAAVPGGVSRFTGPHANAMALWLESLGLRTEVVGRKAFSAAALEVAIWSAAFGMLCERYGRDVAGILDTDAAELHALGRELCAVGRAGLGVDLDPDALIAGLPVYAGTVPRDRAGIHDWRWRGGWFHEAARARGIKTPTQDALIAKLKPSR
jgi:hypothetical protein